MTSITVCNLDDGLTRRLRVRAVKNGRSVEQEARNILCAALGGGDDAVPARDPATAIHERFEPLGSVELDILSGQTMHEPPRLAGDKGLGTAIHELFKPMGGVDMEIPPRQPMREPPRFD